MSLGPEATKTMAAHSVRRYRRASGDGLPFVPFGLLPVLGLIVLTLIAWTSFATHSVETVVRRTAERVVAETGADWASVSVSGQWIKVTGTPDTPEAGQRLLTSLRTARAPTWLGLARPATRVTGDFGGATPRPNQASAPAGTAAQLSGDPGAPEFLFRLTGARMALAGRMPDIATRDAVVAAANTDRPSRVEDVVSTLETIGIASPDGFLDTALRGVEVLKLCDAGTASFTARRFDVRCELPESEAERARVLASAPLAYGSVGEVEILPKEIVETCEEELTRLLEASRIEFDPGSDQISSSKAALLDLTARAAADCPGTLRVEGHTDNTGSAAINENLSRRRAEAVRAALIQRGVAPSRLIAAGYGPARPIGDNATEEGRALNRRIEIRIVRPGE